jgi:hypothetical protein
MKSGWMVVVSCVLIFTPSILGQNKPVKIALSKSSSTPASFLLDTFPKVGCANVSIVLDESTADYILEAHEGDFEGPHGSEGSHPPRGPRPKANYTLSHDGAIVYATTPIKEKSAVKDVCNFLQKASPK